MTQVDVLESGRVATEMIARQLGQMTPSDVSNAVNFQAVSSPDPGVPYPGLIQTLPGTVGSARTNVIEQLYFLTRMNQQWQAYGYRVNATNGVGTLYQYYGTTNAINNLNGPYSLYNNFLNASFANLHRVVDGVVDFKIRAFDARGHLINYYNAYTFPTNFTAMVSTNLVNLDDESPPNYYFFASNAVPAYVEFELGILEQRTLERFKGIPDPAQVNFLKRQPGAVHLFRQRIAVRAADRAIYRGNQ